MLKMLQRETYCSKEDGGLGTVKFIFTKWPFAPVKIRNPPLGSVEIVQLTLVLLNRAAYSGASRVVRFIVLIAVLQLTLPLPRLCLH